MMLSYKFFVLLFGLYTISACQKEDQDQDNYWSELSSVEQPYELENFIIETAKIQDIEQRELKLDQLWDTLKVNEKVPFTYNDSVYFLYKGSAGSVSWAGDFNGWNPSHASFQGSKIENTDIWLLKQSFPPDARLDYKIVINNKSWILDNANPHRQASGFGSNSELRMPMWEKDPFTIENNSIEKGVLSDWQIITSTNLGYDIQYKVYTPSGYDNLSELPVIYITDGHEYSSPSMGNVTVVLDNLIGQNLTEAIIAVFIDPREPGNAGNNRRMTEYEGNDLYLSFVADELVPLIDQNYKTSSTPEKRMILGTSMGGLNSAYFGVKRSDVFGCAGIHSPAFQMNKGIYDLYKNSEKLPLKIFMSTGVIYDTQENARQMRTIMENKGYELLYIEVNEGHSWGNWRQLIDEPVIYFFGK